MIGGQGYDQHPLFLDSSDYAIYGKVLWDD